MAAEMGKFDGLAEKAIGQLEGFFDAQEKSPQQIAVARVAATVISSWSRHRQTEGAREASLFMMARELAGDKEQLERYVRVAMPASPIVRALPVPPQLSKG